MVTARIAGFSPGTSPPPVRIPMTPFLELPFAMPIPLFTKVQREKDTPLAESVRGLSSHSSGRGHPPARLPEPAALHVVVHSGLLGEPVPRLQAASEIAPFFVLNKLQANSERRTAAFQNAACPVMCSPMISAWLSCVPSWDFRSRVATNPRREHGGSQA